MNTYQHLGEAGRETVRLLELTGVWTRTPNRRGALDSVEAATGAGWSEEQCLDCVRRWLRYATTSAGRWVKAPGRQAAARLRDLQMPQAQCDDEVYHISSEYAHLILHERSHSDD
jgi:hypothetical protein